MKVFWRKTIESKEKKNNPSSSHWIWTLTYFVFYHVWKSLIIFVFYVFILLLLFGLQLKSIVNLSCLWYWSGTLPISWRWIPSPSWKNNFINFFFCFKGKKRRGIFSMHSTFLWVGGDDIKSEYSGLKREKQQ